MNRGLSGTRNVDHLRAENVRLREVDPVVAVAIRVCSSFICGSPLPSVVFSSIYLRLSGCAEHRTRAKADSIYVLDYLIFLSNYSDIMNKGSYE